MPHLRKIKLLTLAVLAGLCAAGPCFAAGADDQAASSLGEVEALETMGLYTRSSEGSLGPDLWKGAKRSSVTQDLKSLPAALPEFHAQNFARAILLTKNDGGIDHDAPLVPGEDLFTLRLEKLLQSGFYPEAAALYAQLPGEPYNEKLAYNGALALLFDGDKSSGCIEARAGAQSFAEAALFNNLIEYCSTENVTAPVIVYDPAAFKSYSAERLAMAAADGPVDGARINKDMIESVPASHVPLLLKSQTLPDEVRFMLHLRAVKWGLENIAALQDYYIEAAQVETPAAAWKTIPAAYAALVQTEEAKRWPGLRAVLTNREYGTEALLPFAEMLEEVRPLDINYAEMTAAVQTMIRAGLKIPPQWAEIIRESVNSDSTRPYDSALLGAVYLSESPSQRSLENKKTIFELANLQKNKENYFVTYIIENIDKTGLKVNNDLKVYEKDYRLTLDQDYVMPSDNVWHRLLDLSQESNIGETVLLSTLALGEKTLPELHPDVLIAVSKALEKVGLTDTSERLAAAALIERTFKGEN